LTIQTVQEAETALQPYTGMHTSLQQMEALLALIGNPQDRLKIIHIAGTSGKTSTAYYMASLLAATGQQVGLTVSPHVVSLMERTQIMGPPLTEEAFCQLLGEFMDIVQTAPQRPSYFEIMYGFALWLFDKYQVNYAVVETGIGGLLDATNVTRRPDKVCIITDIGLDHQAILGNSLTEIAEQKLGIVHAGNQVFMYQQAPEIMAVAERWVKQHEAKLEVTMQPTELETVRDDMPDYQQRNWLLAHRAYQYLQERDGLPAITWEAKLQSQYVRIPARMEKLEANGKTIILDGAHNAQKMTAFIDSFRRQYPDAQPAVLIGLKDDKDHDELVPILSPVASRVITTSFQASQDVASQSMNPTVLARAFQAQGIAADSLTDQKAAVASLLNGPESICIITGSFYMIGQIINNHLV
jgi:dihydrofolate synthase / folylpolyglutamate synthase